MKFNAPDHFSHNFELKIEHLPTKKSDRIALSILYPGLFFGTILVALGLYELCNGFRGGKNAFDMSKGSADFAATETFMAPWVFDFAFIALGIWIIVSLFFSYIRYKKIFIKKMKLYIFSKIIYLRKIFLT